MTKLDKFIVQIATLGPVGKRLPAPGTMGSIVGIVVIAGLTGIFEIHIWTIAFLFLPLFLFGIPVCSSAEKVLNQKDPSCVIWDEFCVIPYIFILIPETFGKSSGLSFFFWILLGFGIFRFFDIVKPLGINKLQRIPGGSGIMLDDLGAAFLSALVLLVVKTFPLSF